MELFFALYSTTSRHSAGGLQPKVGESNDEEIILAAAQEIAVRGESLADIVAAGENKHSNGKTPPREMSHDALLRAAITKLGDDGRLYETFSITTHGVAEFLLAAERFHVGGDARALIAKLLPNWTRPREPVKN